jgi:hypothetical protein
MLPQDVEQLRHRYTGKYVVTDHDRPELARFAGRVGQIKTVNSSGRMLVQFEGDDRGWYDIASEYLTIVDKPAPKEPPKKPAAVGKKAAVEKGSGTAPEKGA